MSTVATDYDFLHSVIRLAHLLCRPSVLLLCLVNLCWQFLDNIMVIVMSWISRKLA
jgi:hypothetical protein